MIRMGAAALCTLLYGTSYEYERYRNRSTVECMPQLFIVQYEPAAVSLLLYTTYCCTLILEYDIIRYERSSSCISTAVRHVVQTCASYEYKRTAPLLNACHSCLNYDTDRLLHHCCCTLPCTYCCKARRTFTPPQLFAPSYIVAVVLVLPVAPSFTVPHCV